MAKDNQPSQGTGDNPPKFTEDQANDAVIKAVEAANAETAKRIAEAKEEARKELLAEQAEQAEKDAQEAAEKQREADKVEREKFKKFPYGNGRTGIDITTLRPLIKAYPEDKVTVLFAKHKVNALGEKEQIDVKNSDLQFIDPLVFDENVKTSKDGGFSTYQLLSIEPLVLHDPRKS